MRELAKAELRQVDTEFLEEIEPATWAKVQFNPETLKVSFANQVTSPAGSASRLFVGTGTTKLAAQLWFDVSGEKGPGDEKVDDVRRLTQKVAFFITPKPDKKDPKQLAPPAVRFVWGSFQFDGVMESLEESLELFSIEGKPVRASVSFTLSQQKISFAIREPEPPRPGGGDPAGTRPLTAAPAGSTVQALAAGMGNGAGWQGIAAANGIENPRSLPPGLLLDLNRSRPPGG